MSQTRPRPGRRAPERTRVELLLQYLDQAYERKSWHGTNLRGAIRGLSAEQAAWRPSADRKSVADHVVHAAYWKYAVRRRLRGEKRGSFPLRGSNWFQLETPLSEAAWASYVALLDEQHGALRAAVAALTDAELDQSSGAMSFIALVTGIAAHDLYHTGQIQLLKRLHTAGVAARPAAGPRRLTDSGGG